MADWVFVCATSQLLPGEMATAWDGDTAIVVFNHDGTFYALEDRCSHEDFELSAGAFDPATGSIECVLHGARFDVHDGRALCITSLLLTLLILLHRGRGGGLSDMFGGGVTSNLGASGVAERNLNRFTVILGVIWISMIVILGLITRFTA